MIGKLISIIPSWVIVAVFSLILLFVTSVELNKERQKNTLLEIEKQSLVNDIERLEGQVAHLKSELDKQPSEQIKIVKEVCSAVYEGNQLVDKIDSLPSKSPLTKHNEGVKSEAEKGVVDIDDRLPDDLIRLLN